MSEQQPPGAGMAPAQAPVRTLRLLEYLDISIYSFGLRGFTFTLAVIIVPVLVLNLVDEGVVPADRKNTYLGLATFIALVLAMFVQPAAGAMSDRVRLLFGRRLPYMVLGTVVASVLLLPLALTDNFLVFTGVLAAITLGVHFAQGPYQAFIPDLVPVDKRGLASSYKIGTEILGIAAVGGIVGYIAGQFQGPDGFEWMWAALGVLGALYLSGMLLTLFRVREKPIGLGANGASTPSETVEEDARDRFVPPGFPWYLTSRFLVLGAIGIMETFGLFYLHDVLGISKPAQAAGIFAIVIGVAALFGAFGAGRVSTLTGYRTLTAVSGVVGAVAIAALLWIDSTEQVLAVGIVVGVANGVFFSANWALATDLVSPTRAAQQMGLTSIATAGGAASARLLGFGVDALNARGSNMGYEGLILLCAIAFLLGGVLVFAVRPAQAPAHSSK